MATFILIIIYCAFIGLGLPDSVFGPAWPSIYTEFNLPIAYQSIVTIITCICTVTTSIFSAKIISKFGTGLTTAVSTALTAAALLGFSFTPDFIWMCLLCVPLGLGAGSIDAALNNYVALHYKASHMSFLHCFYGVGVTFSPFLMSMALKTFDSWRMGFRLVFYIQAAITLLCIIAIPLWGKVKENSKNVDDFKPNTKISEVVKIKRLRIIWLVFTGSCAIEFVCGYWSSTYFVEAKGISFDTAALFTMFYYGGIAIGRFVSGFLVKKFKSWGIVLVGELITLSAILLILLPLPYYFTVVGLVMIGLGNGPLFPNLAHLTPEHFGKENSQVAMGTQMAAGYIGTTFMPLLFSVLAQYVSINFFAPFLLLMYAIMIIGSYAFHKCKNI